MVCIKRLSVAAALGMVFTMLAIPADAFSGYIYFSSCACATTADFTQAANAQAHYIDQFGSTDPEGTYLISSTTHSFTAYISVTGSYVIKNKEVGPVWVTSAAIPVDSNGNSLGGLAEIDQETIYNAIDQNVMATSRDFPIVLGPLQPDNPNQTNSAIPSYLTSTDDQIWVGVATDSILNNTNFLEQVQVGDTVTITWQYATSGTITATFQVIPNSNGGLTLKWVKAFKNGNPINRDGSAAASKPNTRQTSGSFSVSGFGQGSEWTWVLDGNGPTGVITIDPPPPTDGGTGGAHYIQYY